MKNSQRFFLSHWSNELAWWWGILLGDGNIHCNYTTGNYKISAAGSISTTTNWGKLIECGRDPQELKVSKGIYQIHLYNKEMVHWFKEEKGICGKKSKNLPWPEDMPREYYSYFFRGLWDSDGTIIIDYKVGKKGKGNPEIKARFGTDSVEFITRLREELVTECGVPKVAVCTGKGRCKDNRSISYSGTSAFKVLDYLYKDCPNHLRNEDRYLKYLEACSVRDKVSNALCACGKPANLEQKYCSACWWANNHTYRSGKGVHCKRCNKPKVLAKGLCSACYSVDRRKMLRGKN